MTIYANDALMLNKHKLKKGRINQVLAPMGSGKTTAIALAATSSKQSIIVLSPFSVSRIDFEQSLGVHHSTGLMQFCKSNKEEKVKLFMYYDRLLSDFLKYCKEFTTEHSVAFTKDTAEVISIIHSAARLYSKMIFDSIGQVTFFMDEFDFSKVQLDMQWLKVNGLFQESPKDEKFDISWTDAFLHFLLAISHDHMVLTFSGHGFDFRDVSSKLSDIFNTVVLNEAETTVRINSFKLAGFTKDNGTFKWNFNRLLEASNAKNRKVIIQAKTVKVAYLETVIEYAKVHNRKLLVIAREENCIPCSNIKPFDRIKDIQPAYYNGNKGGSQFDFVIFGNKSFKRQTLDGKDAFESVLLDYDIVLINTSSTRQASLFYTPCDGEERPLVINFVSGDWDTNPNQTFARFRIGCPDVINVVTAETNDLLDAELARLQRKWKAFITHVEHFMLKYYPHEEILHTVEIDHSLVFKGAIGKAKGKAVSENTKQLRAANVAILDICSALSEQNKDVTIDEFVLATASISKEYRAKRQLINAFMSGVIPKYYTDYLKEKRLEETIDVLNGMFVKNRSLNIPEV